MLKRFRWFLGRGLLRNKRGFTLIEVVIAILVLGIVVASVPLAMIAIGNAQTKANEHRVAENLTRSQFEYVKSQDYLWGNVTYPQYQIIPINLAFGLTVEAQPINAETGDPYVRYLDPVDGVVKSQDDGIQEITVKIYSFELRPGQSLEASPLLESKNYKVAWH